MLVYKVGDPTIRLLCSAWQVSAVIINSKIRTQKGMFLGRSRNKIKALWIARAF